jgi:Mrp family chromosome partitioning ATPase
VSEKTHPPKADPPLLQLFQALGEPAPPRLVKKESPQPIVALPVNDIVDEVSQSSPKSKDERKKLLRVIVEHTEEPFIVPFTKPEPLPEKPEAAVPVLKIVAEFVPPVVLPKMFRKHRQRWRKEKMLYRSSKIHFTRSRKVAERKESEQSSAVLPCLCVKNMTEPKPEIDVSTFRWSVHLDSLMQTAGNQIRMLTDHLIVHANQGVKVICFKSLFPSDGCSTILLCAVRALMERKYRILLVDAHHRHVDLPKQLNLLGNLDSESEVIVLNEHLDLWVWQESKTVEQNTALLAETFAAHREEYDFVLLDSVSLTESPLAEFVKFWNRIEADGLILVSNMKHPSAIPVSHIARRLRQHHVHLIGITENYV